MVTQRRMGVAPGSEMVLYSPQAQNQGGGANAAQNAGMFADLAANYARFLEMGRQRLGAGVRGLGGLKGIGGKALMGAGVAGAALGVGAQAYDTLTNRDANFDIGGQLAGNALGLAALPLMATPLAPLTPLVAGGLSYLGGELGKRNLNLIPDDPNRQLQEEQRKLQRTLESTDDPVVQQMAIQRSREKAQQIIGGGGGGGSTPSQPEFNPPSNDSEVYGPSQMLNQMYDPNGIVQRGKGFESERQLNQALRLGQDIHRRFMEAQRLATSGQQAANILEAATQDSDSHRRFLVGIANSRIY